jgi:HPt (histidine-containing phosphotransfer) domain-containing protein
VRDPEEGPIDQAVLAELLESTGGDREFLAELIDTYLDDAPRHVAAMRQAARAGNLDELVRPAHALKGASASLGASMLSERSRALEVAARSGALSHAADAIDEIEAIEAELGRVTAALRAL